MASIWNIFGRSKPSADKVPVRTNSTPDQGRGRAAIARDAIQEPKTLKELVDRIESDTQFLLGKLAIKALVCSAKVSIECDDAHRADADELTALWERSISEAFECFGFGRACFEKRYGPYANGRRPIIGLDPLPFEDTEMVLNDAGQFTGVKVKTNSETLTLDSSCVWWCALDATPKEPHGRSRYRGAPLKVWRWRQQSDKNWEIYEKKFALGVGVMRAPSRYPDNMDRGGDVGEINAGGMPADPMADAMVMLEGIGSGGYAVLPSETDAGGRPFFDYTPPSNTNVNSSPIENRRRVLDAMALRSLGVPERAVTQDEATGSYGMAEVHRKVLANTCEEILQQILTNFQEGVVDPWAQQNFGSHTKFFVVSQPIVDESKQLVVDVIKAIITGQSPMAEALDIAKLLEIADLPASENIGDVLEKVFKQISAANPLAGLPFPGLGQPSTQAPAAGADVAATALNGAQISSLVEIIQQVSAGQLPLASAKPILEAAFPTLSAQVLDRIVRPVSGFTPASPMQMSLKRLADDKSNSPPINDTWEDVADQAIKETEDLAARIKTLPQSAEAGRLLRQDS